MELEFSFYTIVSAIIKLFILMSAGYVIYHLKIINDDFTDKLSLVLIRIFFPALIISKTTAIFSYTEFQFWWFLPICSFIFTAIGAIMGSIIFRSLRVSGSYKEFVMSCSFQNCGYLPMNLILFSFAGAIADRLLIYLFLFMLGFNILMWSFVPFFLSRKSGKKLDLKILLNPPVIATLFSLIWVAVMGTGTVPQIIADPLKQLGHAAFPIAMMTLGAYLCRYQAYKPKKKLPVTAVSVIKLLLLPGLVLLVLLRVNLSYDYKFFLFLQATMPTAVSLVVIGSYTGADNRFFSSTVFYTHLIAIFSIPIWLAVFNAVIK